MLKYCKLKENGEPIVALFDMPEEEAQKSGFSLMEVEQDAFGIYFLSSVAEKAIKKSKYIKEMMELEDYLSQTDWYLVREFDSGTETPTDIKQARAAARTKISELREFLEALDTSSEESTRE